MFNKSFKAILLFTLLLLATVINAAQTVTYFHNDISGTPLVATDASGNVVWKENYYPYGERLKNQEGQQVASTNNKLWFTGKPHDEDIGLSYLGARYYNPVLGRFMGIDPADVDIGNIHSFNRYAYANNNPYKYIDLNGKWAEEAIGGLSLAISINSYAKNPSILNGIILGVDTVLVAIPVIPAFVGLAVHGTQAIRATDAVSDVTKMIPDNALVCRGGTCTADRFAQGSGVKVDSQGNLTGVSVNSAPGKTVKELSQGIPNKQIGVTTAGDIRKAGGNVTPSGRDNNPYHCTLCGITPQKAEQLFTPTIKNPNQ